MLLGSVSGGNLDLCEIKYLFLYIYISPFYRHAAHNLCEKRGDLNFWPFDKTSHEVQGLPSPDLLEDSECF